MTQRTSYDAGRRCDNCGAKSAPWKPRRRKGDDLLCDACYTGKTAVKDGDIVTWEFDPDYDYQVLENPESGEVGIQRLSPAEGDVGRVVPVDELTVVSRKRRKIAHDSPGTDILRHCPFCGAGQLVGRSDGTTECGFCDAAFTVQTQPNLPSTPQTVNDDLYMHPEMSEPGVPEGELDPEAEQPEETELPLTPEESGREPGDDPFEDIEKMTFKVGTATLSASEYIKHLALKHADNRMAVLREVRASHR